MTSTDIVLVLYGDDTDLKTCVKSIEDNCSNYNLIIIDNNKENTGFTRAVNKAILESNSPYVWLLNQDAVVTEGAQEALIKRLQAEAKNGIAGSMQIDPDDPDIIRHGGTMRAFPSGVHKGGRLSEGACGVAEKQTWVNFASVMFKREMINNIGVLDDNMFLLFSDSDYCYWARYRGWDVWYEPASVVRHRLGKASKSVSEWHKKDMEAFMYKWGIGVSEDGKNYVSGHLFHKLDSNP